MALCNAKTPFEFATLLLRLQLDIIMRSCMQRVTLLSVCTISVSETNKEVLTRAPQWISHNGSEIMPILILEWNSTSECT